MLVSFIKKAIIIVSLVVIYQIAWFVYVYLVPYTKGELKLSGSFSTKRILLDPGHGGSDLGTPVASPLMEKDFNLTFSKCLIAHFSAADNISADLSRNSDIYLGRWQRVERANRGGYDAFISVHGNCCSRHSGGYMVIHSANGPSARDSERLAKCIADSLDREGFTPHRFWPILPPLDRLVIPRLSDWIRYCPSTYRLGTFINTGYDITVLDHAQCPAVLIEVGFLSNARDLAQMNNPTFLDRFASAVQVGLEVFFTGNGVPG